MFSVNECHRYSRCENTYGSYNCSCLNGFQGNGTFCFDIDECARFSDADQILCNNTGKCVNTIGFYKCDCHSGYSRLEDSHICTGLSFCSFLRFAFLKYYY